MSFFSIENAWQIWLIFCFISLFIEMFSATQFFLNLSIAALIVAFMAYFGANIFVQFFAFAILSILLYFFMKKILAKFIVSDKSVDNIYIDRVAVSISDIDEYQGRIRVYDEEWEARSIDNCPIPKDTKVRIISMYGMVMNVKQIKDNGGN